MNQLIEIFKKFGALSNEEEQLIFNTVQQIEVAPKTILQNQYKVCSTIYFVEKGIARTFYYKDGKDITYWIALENDFVGSMSSFFLQEPSDKLVETIEPCVLWAFEYQKLETLFSTNQKFEKLGRLFSNYGISLLEQRFDNIHFNTAKQRYDILIEQQPELLLRIPLGMIASYLGITQETLSRIRNSK